MRERQKAFKLVWKKKSLKRYNQEIDISGRELTKLPDFKSVQSNYSEKANSHKGSAMIFTIPELNLKNLNNKSFTKVLD